MYTALPPPPPAPNATTTTTTATLFSATEDARTSFKWLPVVAQEVRGRPYTVHNRAPDPKAPESGRGGRTPSTPPFRGAPPSPAGCTQPAHFQSRLTSHNKECRDGEEAQHQPAAQVRLSGSCSALTFEAMGTLLKEQMLTDVQAHEQGNYTSG